MRNDVVVEAYVRASDGFLAPLRGAVVIIARFPGVALVSLAYPCYSPFTPPACKQFS